MLLGQEVKWIFDLRTIQDPDRRVGSRIFGLEKKDFGELKVGS